jgi:hypothetical protein
MPRNTSFVNPRDALILGNDRWEDDRVTSIDFTEQSAGQELDPGETLTALEIVSNEPDITIGVSALGTTRHPGDIDNDGSTENIVRYRVENRPDNPTDTYNTLPGLTTTAPFGQIGQPIELIPGSHVGPVYSFRVVVENRSDGLPNPQSVPVEKIGVTAHARVLRNTSVNDLDTSVSNN